MAQAQTSNHPHMEFVNALPLNQALGQLPEYGPGSSRGALLPVDAAVRASLNNPEQRRRMEEQLLEALATASIDGQNYLIHQLTWVGGLASLSRLTSLLGHPQLADPARRTLEVIPGDEVLQALREAAPRLQGVQQAGVIQSLGRRRDVRSVRIIVQHLDHHEDSVAEAALRALGHIASPAAGRALRRYLGRPDAKLKPAATDAARECADRLEQEGHPRDAARLQAALVRA